MREYAFEVVNVFAETTFGGNPLAVFPRADGLSDEEMQALTDQLNLSETTFVTASAPDSARVRIFSPGYEMDFAGHPTLGTAHVVREVLGGGPTLRLDLNIGPIPVTSDGDVWELQAAPARWRDFGGDLHALAEGLGIPAAAITGPVRFVSCGIEQLLIPLVSPADVRLVRPALERLLHLGRNLTGHVHVYVFAREGNAFTSRFFWEQHGGLREDPGTGSACANLGGWLQAQREPTPLAARVEQGHAVGRLNVLSLRLDGAHIYVGGRVVPLMSGVVRLPSRGAPSS